MFVVHPIYLAWPLYVLCLLIVGRQYYNNKRAPLPAWIPTVRANHLPIHSSIFFAAGGGTGSSRGSAIRRLLPIHLPTGPGRFPASEFPGCVRPDNALTCECHPVHEPQLVPTKCSSFVLLLLFFSSSNLFLSLSISYPTEADTTALE